MTNSLRCTLALILFTIVGCAAAPESENPAALTWAPLEVGTGCSIEQVVGPAQKTQTPGTQAEQAPRAIQFITVGQPNDPQFNQAVAKVLITRRDKQPLATLGEFTAPGAALRFTVYRDASTGDGFPNFCLLYLFLLVQHPDGTTSRLLWESPYNGYSPMKKIAVPVDQWTTYDVAPGIFWPQTDTTNFNMGTGFQTLPKYASGFISTRKDGKTSPPYSPTSPIIGIGVGSGPNLGGRFHAYLSKVELVTPGQKTRVFLP